ncbi:hypothetical protein G5714_020853 [Onychostoma macrolepis]|uniref:Uncharacterized protein n=1 Tax=Onychostoma macrolepis TaxID=369639 RepID=A0A7J6BWE0_9TELE|nr:hypothetical protein G5714_020853 [Onychostoma macrolepis]
MSARDGWESASMSKDDDDDGKWVNVHHSSDEDQKEVEYLRTGGLSAGMENTPPYISAMEPYGVRYNKGLPQMSRMGQGVLGPEGKTGH